MNGKQLKNSILQWAIQGKLVPQDPNDEPASVLLERIRAEKARLVKEKKIKKDKNESIIYVMSSGATERVAYSTSICLLLEMQWVNSGFCNDGEFFHGPFEIVDKDVPYLLLMNDGRTRAMDSRALDFLNRFDAKTTVIDAKDFGLSNYVPASVAEYFSPMLITGVVRVYFEQLAIARNHPLSQRRYMWKLEY